MSIPKFYKEAAIWSAAGGLSAQLAGLGVGNSRNQLMLIGDSYEDLNGVQGLAAGINALHQSGYFNWANIALGGQWTAVNKGLSGKTIAQIAPTVPTALSENPQAKYVLMGGGTNGIGFSGTVLAAVDADFSLLKTAYAQIIAAGRVLICRTPASRGAISADQLKYLAMLASRIRMWALRNGVPCLDLWSLTANPSTGAPLLAGEYSVPDNALLNDNTHMSFTFTAMAGDLLAKILAPYTTVSATYCGGGGAAPDVYSTTNPYGDLLTNPKLLGTGGAAGSGASGAVATGWSGQVTTAPTGGTVVHSQVADVRYISRGNWQQIAVTGTARAGANFNQAITLPNGIVAGDVLTLSTEIKPVSANWGGASGALRTIPELAVIFYSAGYAQNLGSYQYFATASDDSLVIAPSGAMIVPDVIVPSNAVYAIVRCSIFGVGVLQFANPSLRRQVP